MSISGGCKEHARSRLLSDHITLNHITVRLLCTPTGPEAADNVVLWKAYIYSFFSFFFFFNLFI